MADLVEQGAEIDCLAADITTWSEAARLGRRVHRYMAPSDGPTKRRKHGYWNVALTQKREIDLEKPRMNGVGDSTTTAPQEG